MTAKQLSKPDFWVIRFTGIDGQAYELDVKFTAESGAKRWAKGMPDWQAPQIIAMWDYK